MKLFCAFASPFVRKVRILARETGVDAHIDEVVVKVAPTAPSPDVYAINPLGKIPALITDDGKAIFDSSVICAYLDSQHPGSKMIPTDPDLHWRVLTIESLCDGILDAAILRRYEIALRPDDKRSPEWLDGQRGKVMRGLNVLEHAIDELADNITLATIAIGCVCGYLDFRFADEDWRTAQPRLATWFGHFSQRSSMQTTIPTD